MPGTKSSGRRPAPTALKVVRGDRSSRINAKEPPAPIPGECPKAPEHLTEGAAAVWDQYAPGLHAQSVLTEWDLAALEVFAVNMDMHRVASAQVAEDGIVLHVEGKPIKNPAATVQAAASSAIRQFAQEFGMTPSARSRITVDPPKEEADDRRAAAGELLS